MLIVWYLSSVPNQIWFEYLLQSLRSTHLRFRRLFDDVTRITGFDFWSHGHPHGRESVMHIPIEFGADIFIQFRVMDIFPKIKMAAAPSWIFRLCEFDHSSVLIVWYLSYVPNLVQISILVTEIDARMFQTFI